LAHDAQKPVLYPLRTAKGTIVTRGFPLEQRPGERIDHPHHAGLWFNYESVNGIDFWNNSDAIKPENAPKMGAILHRSIVSAKSGSQHGELDVETDWITFEKTVLLKEHTHFVFRGGPGFRSVDRITTLRALDKKVDFKDEKDGVLGLRVVRALEIPSDKLEVHTDASGRPTSVAKLDNTGVNGTYLTSEGKKGDAAWGTRGRWCNLSGLVGDEPSPSLFSITLPIPAFHLLARPRLRPFRGQSARPENFQRRQTSPEFFSSPRCQRHISLPHPDLFGHRHLRCHRSRLQGLRRRLSLIRRAA